MFWNVEGPVNALIIYMVDDFAFVNSAGGCFFGVFVEPGATDGDSFTKAVVNWEPEVWIINTGYKWIERKRDTRDTSIR